MTRTIVNMILSDYEDPGVFDLLIDFSVNNNVTFVNEVDVPENTSYGIVYQRDEQGITRYLNIINFFEFMKQIDEDTYLPELGKFNYENFKDMSLKEILKRIDFSDD